MSEKIPVSRVGTIAEGESKVVRVGTRYVAVFNSQGQHYAIDDCCPHAGASLGGGQVVDGTVTCPWHAWRFRLCDGVWADSPRVKTRTWPVEIIDDVIYVINDESNNEPEA